MLTAHSTRLARKAAGLFLVLSLKVLLPLIFVAAVRSDTPSKEYQLKAVLLWRLAQYTEWPTNTFSAPETPIIIGVLGENPFGDALDLAIKDETAHGRKLSVRPYKSTDELHDCHLLFIAESERTRLREIISRLRGRSVLTVSDLDRFAGDENGMVQFAMEENKVTLIVNLEAVTAARLVLDARLLRMAEIAKGKSP
jgi:hypothetical protein